MFKKTIFFFLGFFFLLALILILIILNLNYILNESKIKNKLLNFLKKSYKIELKYEKVRVNFSHQKVSIKKLFFKSRRYKLFLPEGNFVFSFSKLLKLNFVPKEIYIQDAYLKIHRGKKSFRFKKFVKTFSKLTPFYLNAKNITADYETPIGWVNLKKLNLKIKIDKYQTLYEIKSNSNLFEEASIKGRFNNKNLFFENSLYIKNLNLSKFKKLSKYRVFKTLLDLKSETVLEKNTLNVAFIILKKFPSKKLLSGHLKGLITSKKNQTKITITPLILNYPNIKGSFELIKNKEGYKILINAEKLNFSDIEHFLIKVFPENKKVKSLLSILRSGEFYNIKIETFGKNIKDIFKTKNFVIKASLNQGKIRISKLPFDFKNIQGDLIFKKNILDFKGKSVIRENTLLQVKKLNLRFGKKKLNLFIKGTFYSHAEEFKDIVAQLIKKPDFLKKYKFKGNLRGNIELKGEIPHVKGKIDLFLNDLIVKTPYYNNPILIENGKLSYDFNRIYANHLKISFDNVYIEDLTGDLNLKSLDMKVLAKNIWIPQSFVEDLSQKYLRLKDLILKYNVSFAGINLDYLKYEDNLSFLKDKKSKKIDYLNKDIIAQGNIINLVFQIPYKKEVFNLKTEKLFFEYNKGKFLFNNTVLNIEDSLFKVEGSIKKKQFIIKGTGELNKNLEKKFEKFSSLLSKLSIKTPVKFNKFKIFYSNNTFIYSGNHNILGFNIDLDLRKNKDLLDLDLVLLNQNSDMKIQIEKRPSQMNLKAIGKLKLEDFSKIFNQKKHSFCGELETFLNLSIPLNSKINNFKGLTDFCLTSTLILQNSYLKLDKVRYFHNQIPIFLIDLSGNFTKEELKIPKFTLKWKNFQIKGNLILEKKKNYFYLSGNLSGRKVNLKQFIKEKKIPKKPKKDLFQILDGIPLVVNINFHLDNLILPTSHQLENIDGEISFNNIKKFLIVDVPKIQFCSLNLQTVYEKDPEAQYIFIEILPSKGDFLDFFSCLYPEEMPTVILEGPYNLAGYFYAEGNKEKLIKKSIGEIKVKSNKGYIYRAPLLARVFAYISPIDLFKGKVPNLENKLLEYEELDVKAFIEDTTLKLDTGFLSAIGFRLFGKGEVNLSNKKLNLTFYISPFKTLDVIIEKIPYINNWILGKPRMLVYLPLQVTGTYKNYNVIPLHPRSIGKGIFTFIFRIFGISEEFFEKGQSKELKKQQWLKEKRERFHNSP